MPEDVGAGPAQGNRSIFMAHPRLDQPTGVVHILNTCKRQSAGRVAYRPGRQKITDPGELNVRREPTRLEEHTSELQSLMRISYAVFCLTQQRQFLISNEHKS